MDQVVWCWQVYWRILCPTVIYLSSVHFKYLCLLYVLTKDCFFTYAENFSKSSYSHDFFLSPSAATRTTLFLAYSSNSLYLSLSISASLNSVLHRAKRTMKNISQILPLLSLKLSHATHSLRIASKLSIVTCPMKLNYSGLLFSSKVVCLFLKHLGFILAL